MVSVALFMKQRFGTYHWATMIMTIDDDIDDNDDDYGGDDDGDGDESFGLPGGVDSIHRAAFVSLELLRLPPILL